MSIFVRDLKRILHFTAAASRYEPANSPDRNRCNKLISIVLHVAKPFVLKEKLQVYEVFQTLFDPPVFWKGTLACRPGVVLFLSIRYQILCSRLTLGPPARLCVLANPSVGRQRSRLSPFCHFPLRQPPPLYASVGLCLSSVTLISRWHPAGGDDNASFRGNGIARTN